MTSSGKALEEAAKISCGRPDWSLPVLERITIDKTMMGPAGSNEALIPDVLGNFS